MYNKKIPNIPTDSTFVVRKMMWRKKDDRSCFRVLPCWNLTIYSSLATRGLWMSNDYSGVSIQRNARNVNLKQRV